MALFKKNKKIETGLIQLHNVLHHSFRNVQKDTAYILQWLNYLYHKNLQQEQIIILLQKELAYTPKSKEEIHNQCAALRIEETAQEQHLEYLSRQRSRHWQRVLFFPG